VVTRNLEWSAAGLECRSIHKDAHLLVINDAAEQSAVAKMLASINGQYHLTLFCCLDSSFAIYQELETVRKSCEPF